MWPSKEIIAGVFLFLAVLVFTVVALGVRAIFRNFASLPAPSPSLNLGDHPPHVTIIRPVKGVEPRLYDCIAASFRQNYPQDKISIRLCLENDTDPAYPILQKVLEDFPNIDARILFEVDDLTLGTTPNMGPNPKIRNISRAYREATGDIVWIVDCNVWMAKGVLGRMVAKLRGHYVGGDDMPYKFVHQLPIVVDLIDYSTPVAADGQPLLAASSVEDDDSDHMGEGGSHGNPKVWAQGGGRLDEMFMATSHAKFYSAINTSGLAPCAVGKSTMFCKSQLDRATNSSLNPKIPRGKNLPTGVDYFSHNICEDHMIGDVLWNAQFDGYRNHGLVWGDIAVQPMSNMSVKAYTARRSRWLRARKFTVLPATIIEPFTESFVFATYFTFAITTLRMYGIPPTWTARAITWLTTITVWMVVDFLGYRHLHSGVAMEVDEDTPRFARGSMDREGIKSRKFSEFLAAWIVREALALPIWAYAVVFGNTVNWRGRRFRIRRDTTVEALDPEERERSRQMPTPELERGSSQNRRRVD
ncbi:ceramide glucosyltransferase [Fusarium proliferatum]|uniref:Ceramide glucosyltransferase n=1 Tax=Gibberella intermedia TaxID=948311 RepID=A0A365MJR5_GIBIN|nr:ceramide glucosyltransferase [Fusarium proliferatum]